MFVTDLAVEGFAHPPLAQIDHMERVVRLPAGPAGDALLDGLDLLRATLDADRAAERGAAGLWLPRVQRDGDRLDQAEDLDPAAVRSLVGPARNLRVTASISPDPAVWRALREHAARDPRLIGAIGEGARVGLRIGWLFNRAGDTASVSLLGLSVGDSDFPATTRERAPWVVPIAHDLGRRVRVLRLDRPDGELEQRLLDARLSRDPADRERAAALSRTFAAPPFGWGELDLLRDGDHLELVVGPALVPLARFGPRAAIAAEIGVAAWLEAPDVLAVSHPLLDDDPLLRWLTDRVDADDATLEQVVFSADGRPA